MSDTTEATTEATTEEAAATESTSTEVAETKSEAVRDPQALLNAYQAEKDKRKAGEASQRELRAELDALKAKIDGKEKEYEAERAQRERDAEALRKADEKILKADIRTAAKGKLADPADAFRYPDIIDITKFEVGEDGATDAAALDAAIDDLISKKPYLAAQGGKRFQGTADGGARNDGTQPSQLSRDDLKRMSPEEISKAHDEGRTRDLLGSK